MNKLIIWFLILPIWFSSWQTPAPLAEAPVVRAILFYSPSCGHCHLVITETLPPLFEKYGEQLNIAGVDASTDDGQVLFMAALRHFRMDGGGVPFLVIGDTYLVGSVDIPEQLPGLIDKYLAQGGVDWPAIPGLAEAMNAYQAQAEAPAEAAEQAAPVAAPTQAAAGLAVSGDQDDSVEAKFGRDPLGNSLAVIVLLGMLLALAGAGMFFRLPTGAANPTTWQWAIPLLCIIGMGVAGYLAYIETSHVQAVCGPVGDCNTVQQSEYARLFGILPIGVLGLVGYVLILLAWAVGRSANPRQASYAALAIFGMSGFGVLFSMYLTFLEPFVIGATCAWCLTSAILITALFWLSLAPAKAALGSLVMPQKYAENEESSQAVL